MPTPFLLSPAITLLFLMLGCVATATADSVISEPTPGTSTPNAMQPSLIERDGVIYPVIEGTTSPNYGVQRYIIRDGKFYDAIPGTTSPNYGSGRYVIRHNGD